MRVAIDWLSATWWSLDAAPHSTFSQVYRGINLVEGTTWCLLALLVAVRFARYRHGAIELLYAATFFTFGLSDFREAHALQTWLIAAKALNLVALDWLRHAVLRQYYPSSRTF